MPERQPQEAAQSVTISVETIALNDIFPDTDDSRRIESYQELPQGNALFATTRFDREQQSQVAELYITKPEDPRQVTQLWQGKRLSRLILVHQEQRPGSKRSRDNGSHWISQTIKSRQ